MLFQVYCLKSIEMHWGLFFSLFFNSITVTSTTSGRFVYVFGHLRKKIESYLLYTSHLAPCFH